MLHDTHVYAYLWITISKLRGREFIQPSFLNSKEDCMSADDEEIKVFCRRLFSVVFFSPFQVLIVCSTGLAGVMLLNYQQDYTVWVLPLIIVCLFAFLVAHCFLSIYEMVVDVLFLCFAVDTKYNDGSPGREFYMDKVLMVSTSNTLYCFED